MTEFTKYYEKNNFNPEEFKYVSWFDRKTPSYVIEYDYIHISGKIMPVNPRIKLDEEGNPVLSRKGETLLRIQKEGYGKFDGHCQHCGQLLRYCCIFKNTVNNELIVVGEICADKRMELTLDQFQIDRERESVLYEETKRKNAEETANWLLPDESRLELIQWISKQNGSFFCSLMNYFSKYGRLTEDQEAAARKAWNRQQQYQKEQVEKSAPVPTGNGILVEGTVIKVKWHESRYGGSLKMVVKSPDGWAVWGSVPSAISSVDKGDKVHFVANVIASDDNPSFGFFKRPRKTKAFNSEGKPIK